MMLFPMRVSAVLETEPTIKVQLKLIISKLYIVLLLKFKRTENPSTVGFPGAGRQ
jgi:hypothetical protein